MFKRIFCPLLLFISFNATMTGCSFLIPKDPLHKNKGFLVQAPKGWSHKPNDEVQFLFTSPTNDIIYADSLCERFTSSRSLEDIAYEHLKKFESLQLKNRTEKSNRYTNGLYSYAVVIQNQNQVNLLHYGFKYKNCYYEIHAIAGQGSLSYLEKSFFSFIEGIKL